MFGLPEALMSFIRRQVGLRTDQASATGSLHAKIADLKNRIDSKTSFFTVPSNTVRASSDEEIRGINREPEKVKEFLINLIGEVRVSFEAYKESDAYGKATIDIRVNDQTIKTLETSSSTPVVLTLDVFVVPGDRISLWQYNDAVSTPRTIYLRNAKICYDLSDDLEVLANQIKVII
jgi:hypothetical protein